jgi:hypothetical protein
MVQVGWDLVAKNQRVSSAAEDHQESPWAWRSNEMTFEECKAECNLHSEWRVSTLTTRRFQLS